MKNKEGSVPQLSSLIDKIRHAVTLADSHQVTLAVKSALESTILSKTLSLPPIFQETSSDCYARRLLHEDKDTGFVIVAMTWGPGQKTSLHDHAGVWCVEGVIQGQMRVDQYEKKETKNNQVRFVSQGHITAGVGNSGALIPPFEHHILSNALTNKVSITIHVYQSDITKCTVYKPLKGGWFKEEVTSLRYI